jgi:hypothetical protein
VRDIVFIACVVGFFAVAALVVRGCELLVGRAADAPSDERR